LLDALNPSSPRILTLSRRLFVFCQYPCRASNTLNGGTINRSARVVRASSAFAGSIASTPPICNSSAVNPHSIKSFQLPLVCQTFEVPCAGCLFMPILSSSTSRASQLPRWIPTFRPLPPAQPSARVALAMSADNGMGIIGVDNRLCTIMPNYPGCA